MMEGDCEVLDWLRYYLSLNSLPPSIIITVVAALWRQIPRFAMLKQSNRSKSDIMVGICFGTRLLPEMAFLLLCREGWNKSDWITKCVAHF